MSAPAPDALLAVNGLVKHFPLKRSKSLVQAVNGISFHLRPGETLALIGESGSGKTTVGRCILRLLDPTAGQVIFRGVDIGRISQREMRKHRSRMQLVFQEPYDSLNPRMRAFSILEEPLQLVGMPATQRHDRIAELFELVRLNPEMIDSYPHQLSGGEQQRLGIARAIATNPDIVVLDEPTSALDISVRAEILDLLAVLQAKLGMAYIFISHDLTAVRAVSHRVAVMYLGRIIEEAATKDLFERQAHPYTQALLASVLIPTPEVPLQPVNLAGEIPSPINLPSGCHLHPRCPFAIDKCAHDVPPLEAMKIADRLAACWRADEMIVESKSVPIYTPSEGASGERDVAGGADHAPVAKH